MMGRDSQSQPLTQQASNKIYLNGASTSIKSSLQPAKHCSKLLHPNIHSPLPPKVVGAEGCYLILEDGRRILEASGGPAVTCIGHGNAEVADAVVEQMKQFSYCFALFYSNDASEELCRRLVASTEGAMAKATIMSSGEYSERSEAVEAAMKLAIKFYAEQKVFSRSRFIARHGGFHGTTLGALGITGKAQWRKPFDPLLKDDLVSYVSTPNMYRDMRPGETSSEYVSRLAAELDAEFERLGQRNVCAFVAETMSGSSLGCLPPPPGYWPAMRAVCDKHGALLILDEVFCGIGRTGTYHAWQQEGVVPDIQVVAKGVTGGYAPISMMLMKQRVVDVIDAGSGVWNHGHTFSSHPVSSAAGVAVQRVIEREGLVKNAACMGDRMGKGLKAALASHPHVGDIRGRGLMWAVELVRNKETKEPFPPQESIAKRIHQEGLAAPWNVFFYAGSGTADGMSGDHVVLAPSLTVTAEQIDLMVDLLRGVVDEVLGAGA